MADGHNGLLYPKGAMAYMHARVSDQTTDICNLIETLVLRDQTIAHLEQRLAQLEQQLAQQAKLISPQAENVVTMVPAAD